MATIAGDAALAESLAEQVDHRNPVAGALVTAEGVALASIGAGLEADYEIGSVSKGVTGMLYVDSVARGEVRPATALGDILPLGDCPAATVTLAALSTHTSGLPRLPRSAQPLRRTLALWLRGTNPYRDSVDELLEQASGVRLGSTRSRYSNLGFELLGHAVASASGTTYADLVERRIVEPLGLGTFYTPAYAGDLRDTALPGHSRRGRVMEPWAGAALGPAGGIRASIEAMARLTAALLDSTAPGVDALDPVRPLSGKRVQIGAAWVTLEHRGRSVTWHNGGTGGFRSWMGIDRRAHRGLVVLSSRSRSVDRAGFRLLAS